MWASVCTDLHSRRSFARSCQLGGNFAKYEQNSPRIYLEEKLEFAHWNFIIFKKITTPHAHNIGLCYQVRKPPLPNPSFPYELAFFLSLGLKNHLYHFGPKRLSLCSRVIARGKWQFIEIIMKLTKSAGAHVHFDASSIFKNEMVFQLSSCLVVEIRISPLNRHEPFVCSDLCGVCIQSSKDFLSVSAPAMTHQQRSVLR